MTRKPDVILIRFGELVLKGNNRSMFERNLLDNVKNALKEFSYSGADIFRGGIKVQLNDDSPLEEIRSALEKIAGISWFSIAWKTERDPEVIADLALARGKKLYEEAQTFAVCSQRSDKSLSMTSVDYNYEIGGRIQEETGLEVDLDNPDLRVHVHILWEEAHLFFNKTEGFGGLPVGTAGDVLVLLSGGIDSPVAALQSMKRGCRADFLHFHAYPSADAALDKKMERLVKQLEKYNRSGTLYLAPYFPFQLSGADMPQRLEMILFRRHIMRVADMLCAEKGYKALVSGESLGQVASQTLENMNSIASVTDRLILRPLITSDKQEIIDRARSWGTYELSIENYKDCCSILADHPRTRSKPEELKKIEEKYNLQELDRKVYEQIETVSLN